MGETEYILVIILFNIFLLAFVGAAIIFVIQYKHKKRENLVNLKQQEILHQKELLYTEIEIQSQTMQHIGRDIHDSVGQKLTLASLYTQQLAFENKEAHITQKIEQIGEILNHSLAELRQLSKSLTDNNIAQSNLTSLLKKEFARIDDLKRYKIESDIDIGDLALPYQTKSVIVRVVQEFLQNSMKYANCKTLGIKICKVEGNLLISLHDDGIGFSVEETDGKGIGLVNMKKRIELIGGQYSLQSSANKGTTMSIAIALPQHEA